MRTSAAQKENQRLRRYIASTSSSSYSSKNKNRRACFSFLSKSCLESNKFFLFVSAFAVVMFLNVNEMLTDVNLMLT